MGKELKAKSFRSGNSIAVRMPAALGLEAGTEWSVERQGDGIVLKPVAPKPARIDLTGIWGSMPWLKPLSDEDRILEPRELDWEGKRMHRD